MRVQVRSDMPEHFVGFFDHIRRRPGDRFAIPDEPRRVLFPAEKTLVDTNADAKAIYNEIKDKEGKVPSAFSFRWMEPSQVAQDRVTTAQQALDKTSEGIRSEKAAAGEIAKAEAKGEVI